MRILSSTRKIKELVRRIKNQNKTIGFIPTMGYFHQGHISLFRRARQETDVVVVSLYVNPTQFGHHENYKKYPRDLKRDIKITKKEKVDILFVPDDQQMYPEGFDTFVSMEKLSKILEGKSRPNHFRGVTTVVTKLFSLVQPDIAYFGQKDYQQAFIIRRMVEDLNFDLKVKVLPTVREPDGLAMSSRNIFLEEVDRRRASVLFSTLQQGRDMISSRSSNPSEILRKLRAKIHQEPGIRLDYLEMVDPETLKPVKRMKKKVLLAGAIFVGKTRLIDNLLV